MVRGRRSHAPTHPLQPDLELVGFVDSIRLLLENQVGDRIAQRNYGDSGKLAAQQIDDKLQLQENEVNTQYYYA